MGTEQPGAAASLGSGPALVTLLIPPFIRAPESQPADATHRALFPYCPQQSRGSGSDSGHPGGRPTTPPQKNTSSEKDCFGVSQQWNSDLDEEGGCSK